MKAIKINGKQTFSFEDGIGRRLQAKIRKYAQPSPTGKSILNQWKLLALPVQRNLVSLTRLASRKVRPLFRNLIFHYSLCLITSITFKISENGKVSEVNNLEYDMPSSML